ncbi:hypothetical protein GHT06_017409 [Daphnia sinensis]|uniref:Uncharacterized protein n=1 Tax=Daphnia sinensis TaxID=1820382 RepID=A0AAD5PRV3_9CRUS|nr:hypothetical protein GHT06_017409 [Daphnia sinensis]
MVLPLFSLCGAVPFDPVMEYDAAGQSVNSRVLVCCHCHVMESLALLDNPSDESYPFQSHPVDSLPDVVPRQSDKLHRLSAVASDGEEPDSPSVKDIREFRMPDEDKSAADSWKQVGHDLRRIADQFEISRRPATAGCRNFLTSSSSTASSWIQTCILHGLIAYAGWRIQRWISG